MNDSLWHWTLDRLRHQTAGPDATPGGGSVAAVTATLGIGLLIMAVDITLTTGRRGPDTSFDLAGEKDWLIEVSERTAGAVDADVRVFETFLDALHTPRADSADRLVREEAVQASALPATEVPLALAEACNDVVQRADLLTRAVSPGVVSDVLAGRDLLTGAGRAALRAVRMNLLQVPNADEAGYWDRASAVEAFLEEQVDFE